MVSRQRLYLGLFGCLFPLLHGYGWKQPGDSNFGKFYTVLQTTGIRFQKPNRNLGNQYFATLWYSYLKYWLYGLVAPYAFWQGRRRPPLGELKHAQAKGFGPFI